MARSPAFSFNNSSIFSLTSVPTTRCPAWAKGIEYRPCPQPTSSRLEPGGISRISRSSVGRDVPLTFSPDASKCLTAFSGSCQSAVFILMI